MKVKDLIEERQKYPKDLIVCMGDLSPITTVKQVDYGNGVLCISDYDEEEIEESYGDEDEEN